ncbi:hypothetical protein PIROE2DRAFT_17393 [Piromyces sp. E2]|nr:hypothetical protein PIROE2DRAFT_17393 [Piromyces sp. E2]|eukprot:OUM57579.1 hypothetical protein PIROE2DRAFT_17393 [Piromyces sp. E2]
MKTIFFSVLFAICITLIKAGGDPYQATWYGGSEDENKDSELNPSCYDHVKRPDTDYYAAISTNYKRNLCDSYAVVMAVDNKDKQYLGKMVKVKIVDSCHECKESHIDLSRKAFKSVRDVDDGIFPVIWVAAFSTGKISREIIYPSEKTEKFAKSLGLSKSQFVSMYKNQALDMIKRGETFGTFNKSSVPKITTTKKEVATRKATTTTVKKTTQNVSKSNQTSSSKEVYSNYAIDPNNNSAASKKLDASKPSNASGAAATKTVPVTQGTKQLPTSQAAPVVSNAPAVPGIGNINVVTGETTDKSVPKEAPIVGKTKVLDPQKTNYTDNEIKKPEKQFPDEEKEEGSYAVGIISTALTVSTAAGVGLLYLKKQSPSKFNDLKRTVSKSASGLKRSLTRSKDKHGDYRAMPNHMFGTDGLPSLIKRDDRYPETKISI